MSKDNSYKRRERIYVCHTFYHVYVACLKELNLPEAEDDALRADTGLPDGAVRGGATLVLSRMSNDFGDLDERARACGLFEEVVWFDEKPYQYFDELLPLKEDTGSLPRNMANRMKFCRRLAELEEPYVPVDFSQYGDIYVFCDSDPIGYYLNYKKIRYHAVEDGLDCIRYLDTARVDNRGHFALKARMAAAGLIFIQNGYARYCIDMEVNDLAALDHPMGKMRAVPRERLVENLTADDRELLIRLFIANREELLAALGEAKRQERPVVLILTEPLCPDLAVRKQLIEDMIEEYGSIDGAPGVIVLKPHPRDLLDYRKEFPQHIVLDAKFPMEILNFLDLPRESADGKTAPPTGDGPDSGAIQRTGNSEDSKTAHPSGKSADSRAAQQAAEGAQKDFLFERVVTVYTVPRSIRCAREKIYLGNAFMDRYEDRSAHENVTDHGESAVGKEA